MAARLVPDGARVLEIGAGTGAFRDHLPEALDKLAEAASTLVMSYCCRIRPRDDALAAYLARGWVNALSEEEVILAMSRRGLSLGNRIRFEAFQGPDFAQIIFEFADRGRPPAAS